MLVTHSWALSRFVDFHDREQWFAKLCATKRRQCFERKVAHVNKMTGKWNSGIPNLLYFSFSTESLWSSSNSIWLLTAAKEKVAVNKQKSSSHDFKSLNLPSNSRHSDSIFEACLFSEPSCESLYSWKVRNLMTFSFSNWVAQRQTLVLRAFILSYFWINNLIVPLELLI